MPPPQPLAQLYSRSQTLSLRQAMATAVTRKLRGLQMSTPSGDVVSFAEVFEAWAPYEQRYISPAACVMPGAWTYDAARTTPTLMEDTWEPQGQIGWGLYKTADINADFDIIVRAASDPERDVLLKAFEDAWVAPEVTMDPIDGARYGVLIEMPEYWGIRAEFSLKSGRVIDDEGKVMREQREAVFTVTGVAPQVKLAPVRPMNLTIRVAEVGESVDLTKCMIHSQEA